MKRIYFFLSMIFVVVLTANIFYYLKIYNKQVNFQKHVLERQAGICSREIGSHVSDLMAEMNYILFRQDAAQFFQNQDVQENSIRKLGVFFLKYRYLVKSVSLYDNQNNVFSISRDEKDDLITDIYLSQKQKSLLDTDKLEEVSGETVFTVPVTAENGVIANIIVKVDLLRYLKVVFDNYHIDSTLWQCMIGKDGEVFFSNKASELKGFSSIETIISDESASGGSIVHSLETVDGQLKVISSWHPVRLPDKDMLLVFSLNAGIVVSYLINSILVITIPTFIIFMLIILFFLSMVKKEQRARLKSAQSELAMKAILESLPAGIMIKGSGNKIKMINSSALAILKIDKPESVIGKDISEMFYLTSGYSHNGPASGVSGTGEYVSYDDDQENEVILYRTETSGVYDNENVKVEALVDISSIGHARKSELLFCKAKTEFLRKVSHDIRNPLNGILNMAASLESEVDSGKPEEKLKLIRECCDDILSVVNDINDFPGNDTGNITIEEIPFSLAGEVEMVMNQLSEKAAGSEISITHEISKTIPHKLTGDPVQLMLVLKTLAENSLKHTAEGEIKLSVGVKKQTGENILLEFILEDTGTGISRDWIKNLEKPGNDADLVSAGSFGLRKAMQLTGMMNGEIKIESPLFTDSQSRGRGTRIRFSAEVSTFGLLQKKLGFEEIKSYKDIRVLVLAEQREGAGPLIAKTLGKLGLSCETTSFNDSTIDIIKNRMTDPGARYSIIVVSDSEENDGYLISQQLVRHNLHLSFLIIFVSPPNKPGNFMKSRHFGIDHYLAEPIGSSEIYDIILNSFSHLPAPSPPEKTTNRSMPLLEILVAEDNHINKIVAQSLFRKLGYEIDLASDGKEAISKIKVKDYDIVFLDIRMPVKTGLDAAYEIRHLGYTMPVVAMTANSGESDKTQALQVGMSDFISKPVNIEVLRNILLKHFPHVQAKNKY